MDRATLDEYRQVLAYLPFEEIEPPAALEDRTYRGCARAPAGRDPEHRPPAPSAGPTARWVTLGAAVTAAAAVIALHVRDVGDADSRAGRRVALAGASAADVVTPVPRNAGRAHAPLTARRPGRRQGRARPDGDGVLYDLDLPAPARRARSGSGSSPTTRSSRSAYLRSADRHGALQGAPVTSTRSTGVSISLESGLDAPTTPGPGGVIASAKF